MGRITEYRRQKLVSAAVGAEPADTSGQTIGRAAAQFGNALVERQNALDKIEYTNAYYNYAREDAILASDIKMNNQGNPLAVRDVYPQESSRLAEGIKSGLPERAQRGFDSLVKKHQASKVTSNETWIFNTQNKNALAGVNIFGDEWARSAMTWTDADMYAANMDNLSATFDKVHAPILTPNTARASKKEFKQRAAQAFFLTQMDLDEGDPITLRARLSEDEGFKQRLQSDLGADKYTRFTKALDKQINAFIDKRSFEDLQASDSDILSRVNNMMTGDSKFNLAEISREQSVIEAQIASLTAKNEKGVNDQLITNKKKHLADLGRLASIASNVNDARIDNDELVTGELNDMIAQAVSGIDVEEAVQLAAQRSVATPPSGAIGGIIGRAAFGARRPYAVREVKAPKTYTEYFTKLSEAKSAVLAARAEGKIDNSRTQKLLNKLIAPLSAIQQFDRLKGTGDNYVAQAYNTFNDFAAERLDEPGFVDRLFDTSELAVQRQRKDARKILRGKMFSDFMDRVTTLQGNGVPLTSDTIQAAMAQVKTTYARALNPDFMGVPIGGKVSIGGTVYTLEGFNGQNGTPQLRDEAGNIFKGLNNV